MIERVFVFLRSLFRGKDFSTNELIKEVIPGNMDRGVSQGREENQQRGCTRFSPVGKFREPFRARLSSVPPEWSGDWGIYPPTLISHCLGVAFREEGLPW